MCEVCDAKQQHHQDDNDDRESAVRGRYYRLAKRLNAVADRFNARHRGAAARKRAQQNPRAHGFGGLGEMRRRNHRMRMPARGNRREQAPEYNRAEAQYEDAGRQHEQRARLADAAHIHEGQQNQNDQT